MSYYFYAIRSLKNKSIYKGITENPIIRLKQHNAGKNLSTKSFKPYELLYIEKCVDRNEARIKEKYYKSGIGREKLKNLIKVSPVAQW